MNNEPVLDGTAFPIFDGIDGVIVVRESRLVLVGLYNGSVYNLRGPRTSPSRYGTACMRDGSSHQRGAAFDLRPPFPRLRRFREAKNVKLRCFGDGVGTGLAPISAQDAVQVVCVIFEKWL